MTPLYLLNFILLQWFYGRLAKEVEDDDEDTIIRWLWMSDVVPLSGFGGRSYKKGQASIEYITALSTMLAALIVGLICLVKA